MNKKVFLSHSSLDGQVVNSFSENILEGALNIQVDNIFNTSGIGTEINPGEDWRKTIIDNLKDAEIVILFISENYKKSEICLNEMGAAWIEEKCVLPVIIPPITFEDAGVFNIRQMVDITCTEGLDRLKDMIVGKMNIDANNLKSDRWTIKKKRFLTDLNECIGIKIRN